MKDEELISITLEKQICHCLMDNPDLFTEDIDNYILSETAHEFIYILGTLKDKNLSFIPEHILENSVEFVNRDLLISVQSTDYQLDKFSYYKEELKKKFLLHNFRVNSLYELNQNSVDMEKIYSIKNEFDKLVNSLEGDTSEILTFSDLVDEHKQVIEKRKSDIHLTTGCFLLDKLIPNPTSGIYTIVGYSGSTKSTFSHYMIKQRITKRLPTGFINTELSKEGVSDSLLPSMIKESYQDLRGQNNEDEHIDYDGILTKMDTLSEHYSNKSKFAMYSKTNININGIKQFCLSARKKFGMKKDELFYCFIDLLSMVEEFREGNTNRADAITQGLNKLNDIALENNIIFFGTVQLKRVPTKTPIEKEEDLERYRPSLSEIKDSGSYEERSRCVLSITNFWNIVRKCNASQIVVDLTEPIIDIQCLKSTYDNCVGNMIHYYFSSEYKCYIPISQEDYENREKLTNEEDENY